MTNKTTYLCFNCGNVIANEVYTILKAKSYFRFFKFKQIKCSYCNKNDTITSVDFLLRDTISTLISKGYLVVEAQSIALYNNSYCTYLKFKNPLPIKCKPNFMSFSSVWKESENAISLDKLDGHIIFCRYPNDSNLQSNVIKISKDLFNWSHTLPSMY